MPFLINELFFVFPISLNIYLNMKKIKKKNTITISYFGTLISKTKKC